MRRFKLLCLGLVVFGFVGCNKDCSIQPIPDCWNPDVPYEMLEPDTNSCLTNYLWEFNQLWLGGSDWYGPSESPPEFNTRPHLLMFDQQGLYYVVYHGDTVQSGRVLTHDFEFPYYSVSEEKVTMEFLPDCVEKDTFLTGYYAVSCQEYGDTLTPSLTMFGQYYVFEGFNQRVGLFYNPEN